MEGTVMTDTISRWIRGRNKPLLDRLEDQTVKQRRLERTVHSQLSELITYMDCLSQGRQPPNPPPDGEQTT